ncbi:MAG: tetratricopeptide repeat protein, partial [Gaiellales bacterium]
ALDEVSEEPCDPGLVTRFACRLAEVHAGQGRFAEAEHVLSRALRVEREVTDPAERAKLEWSLARTYAEQGRLALAERYARNVIAHLELSEGRVALGRAHWALARTLTSQGRHTEAVTHLARARELLAEAGDELPSLALEESRLALASGDTAMAERRARDVLEIATAEELQAGAHLQLARAALTRDRAAQARDHGTRAVALLDGIESPALLADACDVLSRAEEQTGDLLAALAAARRAAAVRAGAAAARPAVGVTSAE